MLLANKLFDDFVLLERVIGIFQIPFVRILSCSSSDRNGHADFFFVGELCYAFTLIQWVTRGAHPLGVALRDGMAVTVNVQVHFPASSNLRLA